MGMSHALGRVDWNFDDAPMNRGIHAIHPYPAKFIPQIPRHLIELFHPGDNSVVLDPFCGSGTTLVEAIDVGVDAWGIDLNPLSCLITKVKTTKLPYLLDDTAYQITHRAIECFGRDGVKIPSIPRLDHWFKPEIQKALALLLDEIQQEQDASVRDALRLALSSIIVRVSNQESDTRYAAVDKKSTEHDVFEHFKKACSSISSAVHGFFGDLFRHPANATVLNRNTLTIGSNELPRNVGLVITSPPYPNAYEYWLYHKYRMYWLSMDPIAVREQEIGARPHYFKKNHQTESDFESQMETCFRLLSQVMVPGARACFLVGRSIIHGRTIDNAAILQRSASLNGFSTEQIIERKIRLTRKTFNPAHSKINQEHLLVFKLNPNQ